MRTKALLLAAAFAAAGVATSMAQVYSVNAVGYVNTTVNAGFNMVSNPLNASDNTVAKLFSNFQGTIPPGTKVFVFNNSTGGFTHADWNDLDSVWDGADASTVIAPGNGVFLYLPVGSASQTVTFVGEVPQGPLSNPLPKGFSIKASQVPQAGAPDALGLTADGGDKIFRYNPATKGYTTYQYNDLDAVWDPVLPSIPVGEAFFLYRAQKAGAWTRTFSVN